MKALAALTMVAATLSVASYSAFATSDNVTQQTASPAAAEQTSEGEIRKVNKEAKKITIKHGELKNLDMPPMTMVFQVKDPVILEKVKQGDKVSFIAEKVGGQFTVTQIDVKQ